MYNTLQNWHMSNIYYQVRNQTFFNKFLAASHASKHDLQIRFNLYDEAFDQCDWSQEPETTWDQLLDIRALQIATMKKPIVFFFSGGTDSYTMYQVFKRNNIFIDLVYIRLHEYESHEQQPVLELLHNGGFHSDTKIVYRHESEFLTNDSTYSNENWIWEKPMRYQWGLANAGDAPSLAHVEKILDTSDFVAVIGLEKPRLHFDHTGVYSYQDDENFCRPMGEPRLVCFYLDPALPELHVKQSYMLLNYVKSLRPQATRPEQLADYNQVHNATRFSWFDYSIHGCGRFGDLNSSHHAHQGNFTSVLTLSDTGRFEKYFHHGRFRQWFEDGFNDRVVKNYLAGINSVVTDSAGKYLLQDPNNFFSIRQFRSKHYRLTF